MLNTNVQEIVANLSPATIEKAYIGKRNRCCCGCSGTYHYVEDASANDLKQIRRTITTIKNRAAEADFGGNYVSVEVNWQIFICYFPETPATV